MWVCLWVGACHCFFAGGCEDVNDWQDVTSCLCLFVCPGWPGML